MALRLAVPEAMAAFAAVWVATVLEPLAPLTPWLEDAVPAALVVALALRVPLFAWTARRKRAERVLVLGGGALADQIVEAIESQRDRRQRVLGIVDDRVGGGLPHLRLGALRDLDRILEHVRPDRVVVALASRRGHMPFKSLLGLRVRGIAVEDGVEYYERLTGKVPIEALTPTSLIFSKDGRSSRMDQAVAWSLSLPIAVVGLILLAPLFALIALAIKLESPGPVFFVQPRVGRGGRLFKVFKFRTMRPATGKTSEWARDNHGRLTRVGRWLRRFRLDEIPQFVNVVKGDMNLVGPRPHPVSNLALLELVARNTPECGEQIPFYALRSVVRPGLTGWAQVRYRYANDLEEEIEKMRYDLYYVKHRSLWLDLRILLETVKIVICGRESADRAEPAAERVAAEISLVPRAVPMSTMSTRRLEAPLAPGESSPAAPPRCRPVAQA
jgi:exopolysaccharide biosynthesis polyprenyl glycosylphosphotransferase